MTRRPFPKAVKAAAFQRANGRCEECGAKLMPNNIEYDHVLADGLGGEPCLENCAVVCKNPCHSFKTRKHDIPMMAKADRLRKKALGKKPKRPWHPTLRRKMSGEVVKR